jgi:hypothetical protein
MRDTTQSASLPPLRLRRAREQLWARATDSDRAAARQAYADLVHALAGPLALLPIQAVRGTRLLAALWQTTKILRGARWGLYPVLVGAGVALDKWFLIGVPLVFLLDRAVMGYVQVRLLVELAARLEVFRELLREETQDVSVFQDQPEPMPVPSAYL